MTDSLLKPEIQEFITANIGTDVSKLALQKNPFPQIDWSLILAQIAAKIKAKDKLPTWFDTAGIIYPVKISIEQTSSEKTAAYKATIVSGESLIDLTGGFGVDDYYFSKHVKTVFHCEMNAVLSAIAKHNFEKLEVGNIICMTGESAETLQTLNKKFDWIYIDPSRRNDAKGKVFLLKDCSPNVPELLDFYFEFSPNILIKTAPILDIAAGLSELKNVKNIHILAVENEVKELLWEIQKEYSGEITIQTVNLQKEKADCFEFILGDFPSEKPFSLPKKYVYEPNAAIMKSGGFDQITKIFEVGKLHQHSHLYTSDTLMDFPGRRFEIQKSVSYSKVEMKENFENTKANITTRNFPDTVETIRKNGKLKTVAIDIVFSQPTQITIK